MPDKIYSNKQALWPGPVRLTLEEKGIKDIEVIDINLASGENYSPEYLQINKNGTVPALINMETNTILDDSTAITEYLNHNYSGSNLLPKDDEGVINNWIEKAHSVDGNFLAISPANKMEMEKKKVFVEGLFSARMRALTEYSQKQDLPLYKEKLSQTQIILGAYAHPERAQPLFDRHQNEWQKAELFLDQIETQLEGSYIVGDRYTLADAHITPLLVRLKAIKGDVVFVARPKLAQYMARVAAKDNFKTVYGEL